MNIINFDNSNTKSYKVAILIKGSSFNRQSLETFYVNPLLDKGVSYSEIMAVDLAYGSNNKVTVKQAKENVNSILPILAKLKVEYILCADSAHYKQLTSQKKPDSNIDNITNCTVKGFEYMQVGYTVNYSSLLYNPDQQGKITTSLNTLATAIQGSHRRIQIDFVEERYPMTLKAIAAELKSLHQYPELAVDIEAFSLRLGEAGIATISFAEEIDSGCAFLVDYRPVEETSGFYGMRKDNIPVRKLLKKFFEEYQGKLVAHNCAYDFKQLVWELFMEHPLDFKGMLHGIFTLTRAFDDTKIMAYCAYNSTSKPSKKLKDLAYEYAGDYAQDDIKDVRKIEPFQLLQYNLTDACATLWVKDKLEPIMIREEQMELYETQFLPMQRVLLQAELHGMPMDDSVLQKVKTDLEHIRDTHSAAVLNSDYAAEALAILRKRAAAAKNLILVKKRVTESDFSGLELNLNSGKQLEVLLHDVMQLPVLKYTPGGQSKSDNKTLKALLHHTEYQEQYDLLHDLIEYNGVKKICSDFIPNFELGILKADGRRYLHGNFNIGGTVSGRLSSSAPNLQNLPSGSTYGKQVKSIFVPPKGKILVYSDFNSLEDYISALLSKDPNKLKVYLGHEVYQLTYGKEVVYLRDDSFIKENGVLTLIKDCPCKNSMAIFDFNSEYDYLPKEVIDVGAQKYTLTKVSNTSGYDGHSLRAFSYFKDELPNIFETVESINSIKKLFGKVRDKSKAPTFLKTYGGSEHGLHETCGFSKAASKVISEMYHKLYEVSDRYTASRIREAAELGYMTLAFGLRLRCPMLSKTTDSKSRYAIRGVANEERTLGNAIGQSYGMLNNRAMIDFMERVWNSPYIYDIMPIAPIHDASYYIVKDDVGAVKFVNDNLIDAMQWQEDPAIAHDRVKIGAELDICYDSWATPVTIPNYASVEDILNKCDEYLTKRNEADLEADIELDERMEFALDEEDEYE